MRRFKSYINFIYIWHFAFITFPALGQHIDTVLFKIDSQLPPTWLIQIKQMQVKIFSSDSVKHHEIIFNRLDITDTSNLTKTLIKIDSLQCILVANDNCALDLDQIKFVQYKTMRATKRAAKRRERKLKKRNKKCAAYDQAKEALSELLLRTPVFFTDSLALGIPSFNGNQDLHRHDFLIGEFDPNEEEFSETWEMIKTEFKDTQFP
jgi:hypothetical protein